MMRPMCSKPAVSPQVGPEDGRVNRSLESHLPTLPKGRPQGRVVSTSRERRGPWYPRPSAFRSPARPKLTWASRALHTSCSLSGVMSTGTSNGEPSSCPPSSWNCTSSRCTSRVAASSCTDKRGGRHSRGSVTRGPPLPPPSGLGKAGARARPRAPPALTHTHRGRGRHPASPREGGNSGVMERRCRGSAAPQPASLPPGVAAGKCRAPPGLRHWAWAPLVPASAPYPWRTGGRLGVQSLPVLCRILTTFCLFRIAILSPVFSSVQSLSRVRLFATP